MNDALLNTLLEKAKLTLRISTPAFDEEIKDIILAGYYEIETRGVNIEIDENGKLHPMILRALMTYVKLQFGEPDDADRLRASYEVQLGQLMTTTGFTNWGDE